MATIYLDVSYNFFINLSQICPILDSSSTDFESVPLNIKTRHWKRIVNGYSGVENVLKGILSTRYFFDHSYHHQIWFLKGLLLNPRDLSICWESRYWNKFMKIIQDRNILFYEDHPRVEVHLSDPTFSSINERVPLSIDSFRNSNFFNLPKLVCMRYCSIQKIFGDDLQSKFVNRRTLWIIDSGVVNLVDDQTSISKSHVDQNTIDHLKEERATKAFFFL